MKTQEELEAVLDELKSGDCILANGLTFIKITGGVWNYTYFGGQKRTMAGVVVDNILGAQKRGQRWTIYSEMGEYNG